MMLFHKPRSTNLKKILQSKSKIFVLFISLIIASHASALSQADLEGSWGVTFPIFGGERLDREIDLNEKDYMSGAQEIIDELPTAGHVITNLSYFANSHYFNTRANTNVDVANEIHPALIPSVKNDGVAVEAIQLLRNSGKKIILYISTNYMERLSRDNSAAAAAWTNYYNTKFGGNEYLAYRDLVQGFVKAAATYADGYWLDTTSSLRADGNFEDFVEMVRQADPTALIAAGGGAGIRLQKNGADVFVDSDGINDADPTNYYVKLHELTDDLSDYTDGHIVPLGLGAPPNSWSYEEFMIPNIMTETYTTFNGKTALKHGWFPIRERWHSPQVPLVFDTEQAYRFVRRITDYGGMITFANTNETPNLGDKDAGHMMSDEMEIMKEVNRRMMMNPKPNYVPYTRPEGASFAGETQYIKFPDIPTKQVGDADFTAATATSGLPVSFTSSNTNVARIVNGKVRIVGGGKTTITATQNGSGVYSSAVPAERPLVVNGGGTEKQDQIITFPSFPNVTVGDPDFDPGVTSNSGLPVSYTSGNTSVAIIVNNKIRILGEGRTNITATQAGNATFNAAPDRSRVLTVSEGVTTKQDQGITFPAFPTTRVGDPDVTPEASSSSGLPVTYTSGNTSVATIVNGKIRILGEGRTNITATQAGNATFNAAPSTSRVLTVLEAAEKQDQVITFPAFPTTQVGDPDVTLAASSSSGLPVTYTSGNTNVAIIVNNRIRILGEGRTNITATQSGNATFNSAPNISRVLTVLEAVEKQDQVITFPSFTAVKVGDPDFDPGVSSSSGLPITYTSGNANVAVIVNNKIRIVGEGSSYITATQAGNATFNAAPDRSRVLTVASSSASKATLVHMTKRNAQGFAIDGNWGGEDGQNIYLYGQNPNNINQQWIEIDRGAGYYSYQKSGTDFCIDGNHGGANNQNIYLWTCLENNQNQHWKKVSVGGGAFKLTKRNATGYAINGGAGGVNSQNISLWNSSSTSQNLHWVITPLN